VTETSLLTISAFARSVGLTPSALRFYDDAGLLAPATVDHRTGYRYYADDQRRPAMLVRQMRELDVPLTTMRAVLDSTPDRAERLLREHAERLTERADRARDAVGGIVRALHGGGEPDGSRPTRFSVGGPELAAAIRQVAPFAAIDHDDAALDCLLLDVTDGEVTIVATDRYRLAARTMQLADLDGPSCRIAVAVEELTSQTEWLRRRRRVELSAGGQSLIISERTLSSDPTEELRELAVVADRFPDYRHLLSSMSDGGMRMIIDRIRLLELIAADQTTTVIIEPDLDQVTIRRLHDPEIRRLPAVCSGEPQPVAFSPALLGSALQSSVGPDVLIDVSPDHAAVIRSADQGSFTTLVMPRKVDEPS
jgi:DNA-binding transcriptional MerR regulator